jgi:short-subunit dehydrogenase
MTVNLKPLEEQVMVLTGATSGIGLVTARMAAQNGTQLVLTARSKEALDALCDELTASGATAIGIPADIGNENEVNKVAEEAIRRFGRIDTWVNNAGVSIYGKLEEVQTEDFRRLFDTNFWGVTYGSLAAVRHMKANGGALINIGSTLSDRAIPIQGMYCASKHAVKGFTDALRMELEADEAPISVTLIKPSAIDTPYIDHAKSYLAVDPINPPPVYAPETVAEAILHCAENPVRDVFVGAGGKMLSAAGKYAPRLTDVYMENVMIEGQKTDEPAIGRNKESLWAPNDRSLTERGGYPGYVAESSLYTKATLHPGITAAVAAGAVLALGAGVAYSRSRRHEH